LVCAYFVVVVRFVFNPRFAVLMLDLSIHDANRFPADFLRKPPRGGKAVQLCYL
jgi:hypothetical protein